MSHNAFVNKTYFERNFTMKSTNDRGFAHLYLLLGGAVVIGLVGFAVWRLYSAKNQASISDKKITALAEEVELVDEDHDLIPLCTDKVTENCENEKEDQDFDNDGIEDSQDEDQAEDKTKADIDHDGRRDDGDDKDDDNDGQRDNEDRHGDEDSDDGNDDNDEDEHKDEDQQENEVEDSN